MSLGAIAGVSHAVGMAELYAGCKVNVSSPDVNGTFEVTEVSDFDAIRLDCGLPTQDQPMLNKITNRSPYPSPFHVDKADVAYDRSVMQQLYGGGRGGGKTATMQAKINAELDRQLLGGLRDDMSAAMMYGSPTQQADWAGLDVKPGGYVQSSASHVTMHDYAAALQKMGNPLRAATLEGQFIEPDEPKKKSEASIDMALERFDKLARKYSDAKDKAMTTLAEWMKKHEPEALERRRMEVAAANGLDPASVGNVLLMGQSDAAGASSAAAYYYPNSKDMSEQAMADAMYPNTPRRGGHAPRPQPPVEEAIDRYNQQLRSERRVGDRDPITGGTFANNPAVMMITSEQVGYDTAEDALAWGGGQQFDTTSNDTLVQVA